MHGRRLDPAPILPRKPCVIRRDREEVFMPIQKSKPSKDSKPDKSKKSSSEIRDDDLRSVSGGLSSAGGASVGASACVSQT